jgi:hypothetical protein
VVEPRKRLLGRQERGRALAQGQGDLLVRTVRGAPAAWGVEKWGRRRLGAIINKNKTNKWSLIV